MPFFCHFPRHLHAISAQVQSRLFTDVRSAAEALDATLFRVFSNVASLIATVGVMARLSPFVTLLACIVVPVLMIPARYENGYF